MAHLLFLSFQILASVFAIGVSDLMADNSESNLTTREDALIQNDTITRRIFLNHDFGQDRETVQGTQTHSLSDISTMMPEYNKACLNAMSNGTIQSDEEKPTTDTTVEENYNNNTTIFCHDVDQDEEKLRGHQTKSLHEIISGSNVKFSNITSNNTRNFNNETSTTDMIWKESIAETKMTTNTGATTLTYNLFSYFGERDWSFETEKEFWSIIIDAYETLCWSTCASIKMAKTRAICSYCRCDQACFFYKDCCPEMYLNYTNEYDTIEGIRCAPEMFTFSNSTSESGSPMISFCPASNISSQTQRESECTSWQNKEDVSTHWNTTRPVSDNHGLVYRNMYCAECHGVTNYTGWSMELFFSSFDEIDGINSKDKLFKAAMALVGSGIYYTSPDPKQKRFCPVDVTDTISLCNVTGLAIRIDAAVQRACEIFFLPVWYEHIQWYKNPFCLLCNSRMTWAMIQYYLTPGVGKDNPVSPLKVLLDLDGSDEPPTPVKRATACESGQIYDHSKDICIDVLCESGKYPNDNGTCSSYNPVTNIYGYMTCFFIYGDNDVVDKLADPSIFSNIPGVFLTQTYSMSDHLYCYCDFLGLPAGVKVIFMQIGFVASFAIARDSVEETLGNYSLRDLPDVKRIIESSGPNARVNIVKSPVCSSTEKYQASNILVTVAKNCPIDSFAMLTDSCVKKGDIQFSYRIFTSPRVSVLHSTVNYLPMGLTLTCQHVSFLQDEYEFDSVAWTVTPKSFDVAISAEKVKIDYSTWTLYVCIDDLWLESDQLAIETKSDNSSIHDSILGWLSFICTLVSMACCLVTFSVYYVIRTNQSMAGLNIMILSLTTCLAQGLVQFGGNQTTVDSVCVVLGILTHFFWLSSVTSMTTSTANLFYALSFPLEYQSRRGSYVSLMTPYICAVLIVPFVFIVAVVIYGHVSEGTSGYASGSSCFINPGIAKQLFFGLPVGVLILINIGLYVFTIVRLFQMPKVGQSSNDKRNLVLYTKLSVVTGAVWIFGFLYEATDILVFAYAYTITTPLIGLFIFLAFVANKRVLRLLKLTWYGPVSRSGTVQSRFTSKTKA